MKKPAPLSQRQVDLLQWIKDDCPDGVYNEGYEHRITARTLERRGLVTISGHGLAWRAAVTEAGAKWSTAPAEDLPDTRKDDATLRADRLIEQVIEAGGVLELSPDADTEETWQLVRMSLKSPNRPHGKKLGIRSSGRWETGPTEIVFVDHFEDYVERMPVPVPEKISKYHPVVKAFLSDKEWQYVTKDHLSRAARILQALAVEGTKRGMEVSNVAKPKGVDEYRIRKAPHAHLTIGTGGGVYTVKIREIPGRGAKRIEPRRWGQPKTEPAWLDDRGWEFISTGRLELLVDGPGTYGGDHYRDGKFVAVEDKLPQLFQSFDIYRLKAEASERERQKEEAERQ